MKLVFGFLVLFLPVVCGTAFAEDNCSKQLWSCSYSFCVDGLNAPIYAEGYSKAEAFMALINVADRSGCGGKVRNETDVVCKILAN